MGKTAKVVVCGAKKSGKTSLLEQAIYGSAAQGPFPPTIEDIYVANVDTERGTREKVRFVDTEGQDASAAADVARCEVPRHLLPLADGFLLVYAVDDERSFQVAEALRRDIERGCRDRKEQPPVVVLANKVDLAANGRRRVDSVQALNWAAREKVKLFEVSSLDRQSLYEPLVHLASRLNPPPNKSTFSQLTIGRSKQGKPE